MALEDSIFADYAAAQGDFGSVPGTGIAGAPQVPPIPPVQITPFQPPQQPTAGQFQPPVGGERDTLQEFMQHPMMDFANRWKDASPAKRKQAEDKIFADKGNPEDLLGFNPLESAEERANAAMEKVLAQKSGEPEKKKPEKVVNKWGKFMKFVDDNPKFLLDMGARLLAPRRGGQSDLGFAVAGISGAVQARDARAAASAKAALAGQKTQAETGQIQADTSKVPSEIQLNFSKIYKNYQDANASNKPAAAVQILDKLTESFWKTGGDKIYATVDEARIAAQDFIQGHGGSMQESTVKIFGQSMESLGMTLEQAQQASRDAAASGNPIYASRAVDADRARKKQVETYFQALKKQRPDAHEAGLRAFAEQNVGRDLPTAPTLKPKRTLRGTLDERSGAKTPKSKTISAKLRKWNSMTKPGGSGMTDMTPAKVKTIVAEIEKDFESYSAAEQNRAADLVEKLEKKFK